MFCKDNFHGENYSNGYKYSVDVLHIPTTEKCVLNCKYLQFSK